MKLNESIAREIMRQFWGEIPRGYDWREEAMNLRVVVGDSFDEKRGQSVMELAEAIAKKAE